MPGPAIILARFDKLKSDEGPQADSSPERHKVRLLAKSQGPLVAQARRVAEVRAHRQGWVGI